MNSRQWLKNTTQKILNFFGLKFIKTGTPQEWEERKKSPPLLMTSKWNIARFCLLLLSFIITLSFFIQWSRNGLSDSTFSDTLEGIISPVFILIYLEILALRDYKECEKRWSKMQDKEIQL